MTWKRAPSIYGQENATLPEVNLDTTISVFDRGERLDDVWSVDSPEFGAGLGFQYVFGERSDNEALLQARADQIRRQNLLHERALAIEAEVRASLRQYRTLQRNVEVLERAVRLAEESLRLANASYREGLIRNTDLLRAQDDVLIARTDHITTLMDFQVAKADILLVTGREIDVRNLRLSPPVPQATSEDAAQDE
jgi:outer membrane protein TolC